MTATENGQNDLVLSARNVGLSYSLKKGAFTRKKFWALKDVSFNLYRGDCLGVVGRNGAGKSSLLKLLAGVVRPDYGEIINHGVSTSLLSMQLGFLPHLTGRENAVLGGMFQGLSKKEVLEKMDDIIEFSELQEFIDEQLSTYSSGMAARLGFAVAFQVKPDVLLVDEVIGVGDASFQQRSKAVMKARLRAQDTTIVFVSHSPASIREMCNRAIWIENHEVQCEGSADVVLKAYSDFAATGELPPKERPNSDASSVTDSPTLAEVAQEVVSIDFTSTDSAGHLSEGWSRPAPVGRWSIQEKVSLTFSLKKPLRHPKMRLNAGTYGKQKILITLNGTYIALFALTRDLQDLEFPLPPELLKQENELTFQLPDRRSPASINAGADTRELGMLILWVEIEN